MYGVWQHGPAFLRGGQPWAVSSDRSKLEEWAKVYIPHRGRFRFFFVESLGAGRDWSDAELKVIGHQYADEVRFNGKPQQAVDYIAARNTAIKNGCPKLTDDDRERVTKNIDAEAPQVIHSKAWTPGEIRAYFEDELSAAIEGGQYPPVCGGLIRPPRLDDETLDAVCRVAASFPNATPELIEAARAELERQLNGTHAAAQRATIERLLAEHSMKNVD